MKLKINTKQIKTVMAFVVAFYCLLFSNVFVEHSLSSLTDISGFSTTASLSAGGILFSYYLSYSLIIMLLLIAFMLQALSLLLGFFGLKKIKIKAKLANLSKRLVSFRLNRFVSFMLCSLYLSGFVSLGVSVF